VVCRLSPLCFHQPCQSLAKHTALAGSQVRKEEQQAQSVVRAFAQSALKEDVQDHEFVHEPLRKALVEIQRDMFDKPPLPTHRLLAPTVMREGLAENACSDEYEIQKRRRSITDSAVVAAAVAAAATGVSANANAAESGVGEKSLSALSSRPQSGSESRSGSKGHSSSRVGSKAQDSAQLKRQRSKSFKHKVPNPVQEEPQPRVERFCVVDDKCRICERVFLPGDFGNPQCRGCSIVDRLPFEQHLFRKLLILTPEEKLQGRGADPPLKTRRHVLTPPPMGTSHALRRQLPPAPHPPQISEGVCASSNRGDGEQAPTPKRPGLHDALLFD